MSSLFEKNKVNSGGDLKKKLAIAKEQYSKTIDNFSKIEKNIADILSVQGGEISLSEKVREHYAIVLRDLTKNFVDIYVSIDRKNLNKVDGAYLTIEKKCKQKGYATHKVYATKEVIARIYEKKKIEKQKINVEQNSQFEKDLDQLIEAALYENVSDIHIEKRRGKTNFKWRKDGSLGDIYSTNGIILNSEKSAQYGDQFGHVIYQVLSEEKDVVFKPRIPQNSVIERSINGQQVRIRLATIPAYPSGFDMVLRILVLGASSIDENEEEVSLEHLGYSENQISEIKKMIAKPVGVIIMAGVTGSGKSTSLKSMLTDRIEKARGRIKVITIEDPPEYTIAGASQVPINRDGENKKQGQNPFSDSIKAAMRCDPDVIMIGEVRDEDSAELLKHAVQSGHQAFTTIHASSGIGIIGRMRSNGIPNDVLGSSDFISGLIYQCLVKTSCQYCAQSYQEFIKNEPNNEMIKKLNLLLSRQEISKVKFRNHDGCENCKHGISGRTVLAETIIPDFEMLDFFYQGKDNFALKRFLNNKGRTVKDHGIEKIKAGICDPFDIEEKVGDISLVPEIKD